MNNSQHNSPRQQFRWGTYEVVVGVLLLATVSWLCWHFVLASLISPAFAVCAVLAIAGGYLGGALNLSWRWRQLRSIGYCALLGAVLTGLYAWLR